MLSLYTVRIDYKFGPDVHTELLSCEKAFDIGELYIIALELSRKRLVKKRAHADQHPRSAQRATPWRRSLGLKF